MVFVWSFFLVWLKQIPKLSFVVDFFIVMLDCYTYDWLGVVEVWHIKPSHACDVIENNELNNTFSPILHWNYKSNHQY